MPWCSLFEEKHGTETSTAASLLACPWNPANTDIALKSRLLNTAKDQYVHSVSIPFFKLTCEVACQRSVGSANICARTQNWHNFLPVSISIFDG